MSTYQSGIPASAHWADELCSDLAIEFGLPRTPRCRFYLPKTGKRGDELTGGCAWIDDNLIELSVITTKQTKLKTWAVIHEMCHFIDKHQNGHQFTPSGRRDVHPISFWDIALPLYKRYRVLKIAASREYIKGRKLIWDLYDVKA